MRIRTDEKPHRERTIEQIADHYGCNKTRALLLAADQVPELHDAIEYVLSRRDLTRSQKDEIAETFSKARGINVEIEESITVNVE
jgi:hypothetical protein